MNNLIKQILKDISVDLQSKIDDNFRNEAFFGEKWKRRKSPTRANGHILLDTGSLRRSIKSKTNQNSITFYTDLPYSKIHNKGGMIKVTPKMKKFFWAKYYETSAFGRKKNGALSKDKRTKRLTTEAEFYKALALMKVGKTIKIPKRQFLGTSPVIERDLSEIVQQNIKEYIEKLKIIK